MATEEGPRHTGECSQHELVGKVYASLGESVVVLKNGEDGQNIVPLFDSREQLEAFAKDHLSGIDFKWDGVQTVRSSKFLDAFKGTDVQPVTDIRVVDDYVQYAAYRLYGEPVPESELQ